MEYLNAFLVGGAICGLTQILIDKTKLTPARILVSYVVLGVFLTAIGLYKYIIEFGGMGASIPLLGFGYVLANGAREAVNEHGFFGILIGGAAAAATGIAAATFFGYIIALIFKPKVK